MSEHATTTSRESMTKGIGSQNSINRLVDSRSPSPFANLVATPLKSGSTRKNTTNATSEAGLLEIKRTRSLDDRHHQIKNHPSSEDIEMFGPNCCEGESSTCIDEKDEGTTALHSSFDVSLLRGGTSCSSGEVTLFESDGDSQTIGTRNTSFDAADVPSFGKNFNNFQKPKRGMHGAGMSIIDLKPPATVRKKKLSESRTARRRSSDSVATATTAATSMSYALSPFSASKTPARTPGRPLRHSSGNDSTTRTPFSSQKSPVPPSTQKRRRAPFAHPARQSPMRRVSTSSLNSPAASASLSNTPTPLFPTAPPFTQQTATTTTASFDLSTQTPTHQNLSSDPSNSFFKKLGSIGGKTQLETTFEADGDSVDTNSPARFRFTSFPASLPRVHTNHYPRLTPPMCPGSVRKRMSFDTEDDPVNTESGMNRKGEDDSDPVGLNYSNNQHDTINQSRDDDGTQNTSLSSLSVEGGHHQHLPHLPHQHPPHFASAPTKNLLLFPGEQESEKDGKELNNNLFGYSDDDESEDLPSTHFGSSGFDRNPSPDQEVGVRRTRLNFNIFLSPTHDKKAAKANDFDGGRRIDLSPSTDLSRTYNSQNRTSSFPSTLSSQTQMNASSNTNEESLIVGASTTSSMTPPRTVVRKGSHNPPNTPHEVHLHFPLESECSPILGGPKQDFGDSTTLMDRPQIGTGSSGPSSTVPTLGNRFLPKTSISSPFNSSYQGLKQRSQQKEEGTSSVSSSSESSTSTQKRRLRPMPDMSAFEAVKSSSVRDRSSNGASVEGRIMPPLIRRERPCPPTPQRTPAWANEGGSHAFISLISNKVLLSCPSQVLEGRSSLETSVLDEDSKASGSQRNSFSNASDRSISAKEEMKNLSSSREDENEDDGVLMDIDKCGVPNDFSAQMLDTIDNKAPREEIAAPPKLMRRLPSKSETTGTVSFADDFEILGSLGSGAFADVYKVRLKSDNNLYAVKRNRRQFRGKRDRDVALAEVQSMQRLQSVFASHNNASGDNKKNEDRQFKSIASEYNRNCYSLYLLFFYRAWQEDGYFYSQTELCCRDTCREMLDSLRFLWNSAKKKYPSLVKKLPPPTGVQAGSQLDSFGRLVPNMSVWKICHDISAGLSHIHSHGIVHQDIKPSNIFFVTNARFGAMCKIGDFGLAGSIGSSGDGQEGDTRYLPPELLASATRHTSADIFSLGLTLYEIATDEQIEMPSDGPRWHQLRSSDEPTLPACRGEYLQRLLQSMTDPDERKRPTADTILMNENVKAAGNEVDTFLQDYINDVEEYDRREEERLAMDRTEDQTPRNGHNRHSTVRSPSLSMLLPGAPNLFSPQAKGLRS